MLTASKVLLWQEGRWVKHVSSTASLSLGLAKQGGGGHTEEVLCIHPLSSSPPDNWCWQHYVTHVMVLILFLIETEVH